MARTERDGVVVEAPDDVRVTIEMAPAAGLRRGADGGARPIDTAQDVLLAGLADAKFDVAATIAFEDPSHGRPRLRAAGTRTQVTVPVAAGQSAVILVEGKGGVFAWTLANGDAPGPAHRRAATRLTFDLDVDDGAAGRPGAVRGPLRRWLIGRIVDPVRAYVLKFVATGIIDFAVDRIEGDMVGGLVSLTGEDPAAWKPGGTPLPVLAQDRPARILLMVHGTFSDTSGSFGQLMLPDAGKRFLRRAHDTYDAVLGFDHKTLAEDTRVNARAFARALDALGLPAGSHVDAVAYSRGGLVYRSLAETILAQERPDLTLGKAVFVGCTNGGTNLAEPDHWAAMIDVYTNAAMAAARVVTFLAGGGPASIVTNTIIRTLGRFVQTFSEVAITQLRVPGLAAMEPDGAVVTSLNGATDNLDRLARYYAVTSNFVAHVDIENGVTAELTQALLDAVTNQLFGDDNDLVVDTASMTRLGERQSRLADDRIFPFGDGEDVYHTVYFSKPVLAERLTDWLDLDARPVFRASPARSGPVLPADIQFDVAPHAPIDLGFQVDLPSIDVIDAVLPDALAPMSLPDSPAPPPVLDDYFFAAEMDRSPELRRPASLFVTVSRERIDIALDEAAAATPDAVALDLARDLEIEVIARSNCQVVGQAKQSVRPPVQGDEILRFGVEGFAAGQAKLLVEVRQDRQVLVSFELAPVFVDGAADKLKVSQTVSLPPAGGDPSTVLRIYETYQANGKLTLRFDLDSTDPAIAAFAEADLPSGFSRDAFVSAVLKEVENAWADEKGVYDRVMARLVASATVRADGLLPKDIRAALWTHRDEIKAIQVISEEPLIPWELLYITDPAGQVDDPRGFLSEWGLVRWMHNSPRPSNRLRLDSDRVRYVIPTYPNLSLALPGAAEERAMLAREFPGAQALEAESLAMMGYLRKDASACDLLHFACHGSSEQLAVLQSDLLMTGTADTDDSLSMDMVKTSLRFGEGEPRPIVFINACQTGRVGAGIGGVTGFADAFLRPKSGRGAGVFVGALWSVNDDLALTFSETFYKELKAGRTLVAAVKAAREACKTNSDFTWLAYSVFGNPFARIQL